MGGVNISGAFFTTPEKSVVEVQVGGEVACAIGFITTSETSWATRFGRAPFGCAHSFLAEHRRPSWEANLRPSEPFARSIIFASVTLTAPTSWSTCSNSDSTSRMRTSEMPSGLWRGAG